jgi:hypothetical protein
MADLFVESVAPVPYVLPMEDRVERLEGDMRDVKSVLFRLEPMIIRIDATLAATLPHLATRAEVAVLRAEVNKDISGLRAEMNDRFSEVNDKFSEVNDRFSEVNDKFSEVNDRFSGVNEKFSGINERFSELNQRISDLPTRIYMWGVLGVLITAYGAGLAALAVLK